MQDFAWRCVLSQEPGKRFKATPKYKMVYEKFAKTQAQNWQLSLRERLWWLAIWQAKPNGHATFEDGQIAELLPVRQRDGQIKSPSRQAILKARKDAITAGQLLPMSDANCLVLPADAVGNKLQGWDKPCSYCMGLIPEPRTDITLRDYETESLERESYRRDMNAQARAVRGQLLVVAATTNSFQPEEMTA